MAESKPLEKEITQYLGHLSIQQKEVVLSAVKSFAGKEGPWWDDKKYVAEMNRRFIELENGKLKGYSLEEMVTGAREAYKNRKRKKQ